MEDTNKTNKEPYIIVIPIYDEVDLIDIAAPREIFHWLGKNKAFNRDVQVYYVGRNGTKTFKTIDGARIKVEAHFDDRHVQNPHVIWVPGGSNNAVGRIIATRNSPYTAYVKSAGQNAEWVCSVCEGAPLLANTGLLDGHSITTHWEAVNCFSKFPRVKVVKGNPRYVKSGNRVTGAGISSGIDEAVFLVELIAGTAAAIKVQQKMQYYPNPPVQSEIPDAPRCSIPGLKKSRFLRLLCSSS